MRPSDSDLIHGLGRVLRESAKPSSDDAEHAAGRARFVETVSRASRRSPRISGALWLRASILATLVVALVAGLVWWRSRDAVIRFTVDGATANASGFIEADRDRAAEVRLSDGSTLGLHPSTRGRIVESRARGVRFSVEGGTVDVHVAKREGGADYQIDAGPYSVRVTGTQFEIEWEPTSGRMHLSLHEGTVLVTGPNAEQGLGLRAGQTLDVSAASGAHVIEVGEAASSATGDAPPPVPPTLDAPSPLPSSSATVAPSQSAAAGAKRESWSEKVASGNYADVLSEAEARGVDAVAAQASSADLMALADAARYGGRSGVASRALHAVRDRFGGSRAASTAAFLLGKMAEGSGQTEGAIRFYDATVAEQGAFASEALGRKMVLVARSKGDSAARPVAESYLKSYPRGPYAETARSLAK